MKFLKDRRPSNPKRVQELAEEIQLLTDRQRTMTQVEYAEKQIPLFQELMKYQTDTITTKSTKMGLKLARGVIKMHEAMAKAKLKGEEVSDKIKKIVKIKKKRKLLK